MTKMTKKRDGKRKEKSNIRDILLRQREFRLEIRKYTLITQQLTRIPRKYKEESATPGHDDDVHEEQPCNDEKDERPLNGWFW